MVWVWEERSHWVNSVDYHVTKLAKRDFPARLASIKTEMGKRDLDSSLAELSQLLKDIGDVQPESRHFPYWRGAMELMTGGLERVGRYGEILPLLDGVSRKDATNIPLQLRLAKALAMVGGPENLARSKRVTDAWKPKISTYPGLVNVRLLRMAQEKNAELLAQTLAGDMQASRAYLRKSWQIYLFCNGEGGILKSPLATVEETNKGGRVTLDCTFENVPGSLKQLRLDAPAFVTGRLFDSSIRIWVDGELVDQGEGWRWASPVGIERLSAREFGLLYGEDPRLHLNFPDFLPLGGVVRVQVEFGLEPMASRDLREFMGSSALRSEVKASLNRLNPALDLDALVPAPSEKSRSFE